MKRRLGGFFIVFVGPIFALMAGPATGVGQTANGIDPGFKMPNALQISGLTNAFRLSERIYSGAAPEGDAGFKSLQELGVRTVLSVDGAKPDVELAHRYGLRYVHLPHGYDGIGTNVQVQLIKAAASLPSPIYVHCHHGQHRGPTAAAVICMAEERWSIPQALAWLKLAGTATNYAGLFKTVRTFKAPSSGALERLPSEFPEVAKLGSLVETMVAIDGVWDTLKVAKKAGYAVLPEHPDIQPANEAVLLREHFREAQRLPPALKRGPDFLARMEAAEEEARSLEKALANLAPGTSSAQREEVDRHVDALAHACSACHKKYRD